MNRFDSDYSLLIEKAPDSMLLINEEGLICLSNSLANDLFRNGEELTGLHFSSMISQPYLADALNIIKKQFEDGCELTRIKYKAIDTIGNEIWIEQSNRLLSLNNQHTFIYAIARDVTEGMLNKNLIIQSEEKYRGIIQNSSLGLLEVDIDEYIQYANKAFCEISGYTCDELIGQNAASLLIPTSQPDVVNKLREINEQRSAGAANAYEIQIKRKDGELIWVLISGAPVYNHENKIIGTIGIHHDISEQKKEAQLKSQLLHELDQRNHSLSKQQDHLSAINTFASQLLKKNTIEEVTNHISDSIAGKLGFIDCSVLLINKKDQTLHYNPKTNLDKDNNQSSSTGSIVIPIGTGVIGRAALHGKLEYIPDTTQDSRFIADFGVSMPNHENSFSHYQSQINRLSELCVPIINEGEVLGVIDSGHPEKNFFTELHKETLSTIANLAGVKIRKLKIEQNLQESEARTRSIIDSSLEAIISINTDGIITEWNKHATEMFAFDKNEITGKPFISLLAPQHQQELNEFIQSFSINSYILTKNKRMELVALRKTGEEFLAELSIVVVTIKGDVFLSVFVRDITIRKKAEEELKIAYTREAELNAMKTRFISMTSHEFRTPLTTIQSTTELLSIHLEKQDLIDKERINRYVDRISKEVLRLTALMNDILVIGKIDAGKITYQPVKTDLIALISEILEGGQLIRNDDRHLTLHYTGTNTPVYLDPMLFIHIITNLATNALKYSKGKQSPHIQVTYLTESVIIDVIDYGIGIPKHEQKDLFQSFFRASNVENIQGNGLGLMIVKQFVEIHQGKLIIESDENKGTRFSIEFPYNETSVNHRI